MSTLIPLPSVRLKKREDRRIRAGHPWIFSNEIDTAVTPLKNFSPGDEVIVEAHDKTPLGIAYINPHSLIAARLFSYSLDDSLNLEFFSRQLKQALLLRTRLFTKPYYRLVFGEADGLPGLVIDRFGNHIVCQINTAGMERHKEILAEAVRSVLPDIQSILLRNDSPIRKQEGLEAYIAPLAGSPPDEVLLEENEVRFSVPLWQGQKTGWFYDHRFNRLRLKEYVANQRVLDVFSYLGAWGIQATVFGASQVDCIEASAKACDFIQKNAALNQIEHKIKIICDDAFQALKNLYQTKRPYDVIILDPPAFVKKFKDRKEGLMAYQRLNELALKLLTENGILITCSCSMHVAMSDLTMILQRAAIHTPSKLQILERGHQAADHPIHIAIPETDYLKMMIVRKREN